MHRKSFQTHFMKRNAGNTIFFIRKRKCVFILIYVSLSWLAFRAIAKMLTSFAFLSLAQINPVLTARLMLRTCTTCRVRENCPRSVISAAGFVGIAPKACHFFCEYVRYVCRKYISSNDIVVRAGCRSATHKREIP